jgi:hypothetical protein
LSDNASADLQKTLSIFTDVGQVHWSSNISYAANATGWLSVDPSTGDAFNAAPTPIIVTADPTGLLPSNTYTATIIFSDTANSADTATVIVTLTVTNSGGGTTNNGNKHYQYSLPYLANQGDTNNNSSGGSFTTFLVMQNNSNTTSNTPAKVSLEYFDQHGTSVAVPASTCTQIPANGGECIAPNPFAVGSSGTGIITSDQPLNVMVAEATPYGGSAYPVSQGASSSLIVPFVLNGAYGGFVTQLRVFNSANSPTNISCAFYASDGTPMTAANTNCNLTLAPNTSALLNQTDINSGLPQGFNGWAVITGATDSQLVAQVLEQNPNTHFVAIANAQPLAHNTLYAPAIFKGAFGAYVTGSNIINPNSQAVNVSITYYNSVGTAITTAPFSIAPHAIASVYQGGSGGVTGLPLGSGLPQGFTGSAIVRADSGGVVMVVNEIGGITASGNVLSGTYAAAFSGSTVVGLPVVANGGYGYTTGATILNTSNLALDGTIQYFNIDGTITGAVQAFSIAPHASQLVYQGATGLPSNFYGTAVLNQTGGVANSLIVTTNALSSSFFYTYTEPNP